MSRFPRESGASFNTSENGATRPTSEADAGRFEVLLHDALLNPVHHLVVDDLLHKTLQNLAWEKTKEISTETSTAASTRPAALPCHRHGRRDPTTASLACLLLDGGCWRNLLTLRF